MSGPVWRLKKELRGTCEICLAEHAGLYVEGEVAGNDLSHDRLVCSECYERWRPSLVGGELGRHIPSPAYARRP